MQNIEIKNVTINDADFLFYLMNNTAIKHSLNEPSTSKQNWIEAIHAWTDDDDENDYIVWEGDKQIGWFAFNGLQSTDGTIYLKMAVISPEYQYRGIGTYVLFQETYHKPTYENLHPFGPKSDYDYHTTAHDRAMQGGIDDVGIGVLYGLYEYKYEVIGTMLHVKHLEDTFGIGPHTISIPRIRMAEGVDLELFPNIVSDEQFKTIIAVLRLAVPYTGMIISTREEKNFRDEIISLGISQTSGGSCTGVGGYSKRLEDGGSGCDDQSTAQFKVSDERTEAEVSKALLKNGYIPSFCTACYRAGRTGDRFMQLAKTGNISNCCLPNAMLTLAEYALDYGDDEFKKLTFDVIKSERESISEEKVKVKFDEYLDLIKSGQRDFRF